MKFDIDASIFPTSSLSNVWSEQLQCKSYFLAAPAIASNSQNKVSIQDNEIIKQIYKNMKRLISCLVGIGNVDENAP